MLEHPALSIEFVPIENAVERIEERCVMLAAQDSSGFVRSEIESIEGGDAEAVEEEGWRVKRNALPRAIVMRIERLVIAPICSRKYTASENSATSAAIYPGHGVLEFISAFTRKRPEFVEADIGNGFNIEVGARDFPKLNLHPFDDPCQTEAPDRRRQ